MIDKAKNFDKLVAANRILAREDVVAAFGHVSLRHPDNPSRYVMSRSRSPFTAFLLLHTRREPCSFVAAWCCSRSPGSAR